MIITLGDALKELMQKIERKRKNKQKGITNESVRHV